MRVQFTNNRFLTEYHGRVDFVRFGEIQEVNEDEGKYLLSEFPYMFVQIADFPKPPEPQLEGGASVHIEATLLTHRVLGYLKNMQPVGVNQIVRGLSVPYTKVRTVLDQLEKSGIIMRAPDKRYAIVGR